MTRVRKILVPRFLDVANVNAQNLNAKSMLRRFREPGVVWSAVHYDDADPTLAGSPHIRLTRLGRRHLWMPHLVAWYQQRADAIFYPGINNVDAWGLRVRQMSGRRIPLVSTIEVLAGTEERERQISDWAGHPVFCQRIDETEMHRLDELYRISDHIIAISPFLARMGAKLYGAKFSVHLLGTESGLFTPPATRREGPKRVINVASLQQRKRPEVFLDLAARFPAADFTWFGEGVLRSGLIAEIARRRLGNVQFPGARPQREIAAAMQAAHLFAMPSNSEGVPKVTQEAASCGLPLIVFGYYEAPTVVNGENGYVVWSDEEFSERVGNLLDDDTLVARMGARSAVMAREWTWDRLAPEWENEVLARIETRE